VQKPPQPQPNPTHVTRNSNAPVTRTATRGNPIRGMLIVLYKY
jgi:hypothetical protein